MEKLIRILALGLLLGGATVASAQSIYPESLTFDAYSGSDAKLISEKWENVKEWKSLNSERFNLVIDYINPSRHEMVLKGRMNVHNVASNLENSGMATFRLSFTLFVKCTPAGIQSEFSHAAFDYYISSKYINYGSTPVTTLEKIRQELFDFIRISRRFGNPVTLDSEFEKYGRMSNLAKRIYTETEIMCDEIQQSLMDMEYK